MTKAEETNRQLREAILDLLSFCAVYKISLSAQEILLFLPVKASLVGVKSHLNMLIKRGKLRQFKHSRYGIKKVDYSKKAKTLSFEANKPTKRFVKLLRVVPFVKSIVLSSDVLLSNKGEKEQSLIIITTPNRIYSTKDIVARLQKSLGKNKPLGDINCNVYYSTAGLRFSNLISKSKLETALWFAFAKPMHGKSVWYGLLKHDKFVQSHLPNFEWPRLNMRIHTSTSKYLDDYDNKRYRAYLKEMASAVDFQQSTALLRVRPDVFIARKLHNTNAEANYNNYKKIRERV